VAQDGARVEVKFTRIVVIHEMIVIRGREGLRGLCVSIIVGLAIASVVILNHSLVLDLGWPFHFDAVSLTQAYAG
jgi:hypothetical protein